MKIDLGHAAVRSGLYTISLSPSNHSEEWLSRKFHGFVLIWKLQGQVTSQGFDVKFERCAIVTLPFAWYLVEGLVHHRRVPHCRARGSKGRQHYCSHSEGEGAETRIERLVNIKGGT